MAAIETHGGRAWLRRIQPRHAATSSSLTPREYLAFLGGETLIALHITVASFVLLEPGASRIDHVAGAGVSLGVLGVAAAFYRRTRAGIRASVSLTIGALALVSRGVGGHRRVRRRAARRGLDGVPAPPRGTRPVRARGLASVEQRRHDRKRHLRRALIALASIPLPWRSWRRRSRGRAWRRQTSAARTKT